MDRTGSFCCPSCKGPLEARGEDALACRVCSAVWGVHAGIPCFISPGKLDAYQLTADMGDLVEIARRAGWQAALARHLSGTSRRRDVAHEYAGSEARGDFRFLLRLPPGATVLDIGSGWGNIAIAFARTAGRVIALDRTLANVQFVAERARQEGLTNVEPVLGDATNLPLPPASCDVVLMVGVLEWVAWGRNDGRPRDLQEAALRQAFEVLKPGGQLYVAIENRASIKNYLGFREPHAGLRFIALMPRGLADRYSRRLRGAPFREYTYSGPGLAALLHRAGFAGVERFYPVPNYQTFRYITGFEDQGISQFLISRLRGHGNFSALLQGAARVGILLRLQRALAPCFSFIATKAP